MNRSSLQLGILVPMVALAAITPETFTALVAVSLIPIAIFQWSVWLYLRGKLSRATDMGFDLPTMRDRVEDKLTLAHASTGAAAAGIIVVLRGLQLIDAPPRWVFLVIISYVMIIIAIPAMGDLRRWRRVWLPALRRTADASNQQRRVDDPVAENGSDR